MITTSKLEQRTTTAESCARQKLHTLRIQPLAHQPAAALLPKHQQWPSLSSQPSQSRASAARPPKSASKSLRSTARCGGSDSLFASLRGALVTYPLPQKEDEGAASPPARAAAHRRHSCSLHQRARRHASSLPTSQVFAPLPSLRSGATRSDCTSSARTTTISAFLMLSGAPAPAAVAQIEHTLQTAAGPCLCAFILS